MPSRGIVVLVGVSVTDLCDGDGCGVSDGGEGSADCRGCDGWLIQPAKRKITRRILSLDMDSLCHHGINAF